MKARLLLPCLGLCLVLADSQAGLYTHIDPVSGMTVVNNIPSNKAEPRAPVSAVSGVQAAFPRVSSERQKQLDGTRREILQTELNAEQKALDAAAVRREASDIVQRHIANVEALKRELAGMR